MHLPDLAVDFVDMIEDVVVEVAESLVHIFGPLSLNVVIIFYYIKFTWFIIRFCICMLKFYLNNHQFYFVSHPH